MKKIQFKRILGVFILICVITAFSNFNVYAKSQEKMKEECSNLSNLETYEKYGVSIDQDTKDRSKYVITIDPQSSKKSTKKSLQAVVFKVTKINDTAVSDGNMVLSYGNPLTIAGQFAATEDEDNVMTVTLESTESSTDPECTGTVTLVVSVTYYGTEKNDDIDVLTADEIKTLTKTGGISCTNYTTKYTNKDSFEYQFCLAKDKATKNAVYSSSNKNSTNFTNLFSGSSDYSSYSSVVGSNGSTELRCSYKDRVSTYASDSEYYVNTSYLFGSGTITKTFGNYTYHYSPTSSGNTDTSENDKSVISCKLKCEESVTVEYGPPVASKAGLCFEYKVKVTSRVNCGVEEGPNPPSTKAKVCTPVPICTNTSHSYYVNQGGPSEEFDSCIDSCDGGKYTDKCSKKCYKKVYGSSSSKTYTGYNDFSSTLLSYDKSGDFSVDTCAANSGYSGCYYKTSSGTIKWYTTTNSAGRWYITSGWNKSGYGLFGNEGIYRHIYSSTSHCQDICWWSGCSGDVYLNSYTAKKDAEKNLAKYNSAVAECSAAASCTTKTAEFTISAKYSYVKSDGTTSSTTVNFPYENKSASSSGECTSKNTIDKLVSKGSSSSSTSDTASECNSTILGYAGCYSSGTAKNWYQAEWSFPGTWINNKTGEISYVNKNDNQAWQKMKNKFCIPLNATDVNTSWWNYYYNKYGTDNVKANDSAVKNKTSFTDAEAAKLDYNIEAKTTSFGYFGWNINIKCFYALKSSTTCTTESCSGTTTGDGAESAYQVRSVDLENLFPATDGTTLSDTSSTGRTAGFNWTSNANNSKNSSFVSYPASYISEVQSTGYKVYSDDYLEYQFNLTPELLNELKKDNVDYSNLSGTSTVSSSTTGASGVTVYVSNLFRNNGKLSNAVTAKPDVAVLGCNNIDNYKSSSCKTATKTED